MIGVMIKEINFLFGKTQGHLHYVPVKDQNPVVRGKNNKVICLIVFLGEETSCHLKF
jgi:hypothetical protein